jgi:hypothetical protein
MFYVYRFGLGNWALLSALFLAGVVAGLARYVDGIDPGRQDARATSLGPPRSAGAFACEKILYSISQDGVRYVREAGGGTVYAARLNQRLGFYQLNPYGYMVPADLATLDTETADNLRTALLQCVGPWLPSGVWFTLSAKTDSTASLN